MALSPRNDDKTGKEMLKAGKFNVGPTKSVSEKRAETAQEKKK